ncbi:MAG: hypothetical protein FJ390_05730 [Verrucomicrobia bacterium]|nr:hypothetical protein [Verrucomicrobiota bacterium]
MNPPNNNGHYSRLLVVTLLFLFVGMNVSLGMLPKPMPSEGPFDKSSSDRSNNSSPITKQPITANGSRSDLTQEKEGSSPFSTILPFDETDNIPDDSLFPSRFPSRLSVDRRLSSRFVLSLSTEEDTTQTNPKHQFETVSNTTPVVLKAAKKFKNKISPKYVRSDLLNTKAIEADRQRSEIAAASSAIKDSFQKARAALQQQFFKEQQTAIQKRAALTLARGMPSFLHPPITFLSKLKKNYSHQQSLATLEERLKRYHLEGERLTSYLLKRRAILPDLDDEEDPSDVFKHLNTTTERALTAAQETGTALIQQLVPNFSNIEESNSALNPSLALSQTQIEYLHEAIDLIREIQLFILRNHTSPYIMESKNKLDEIETYLDTDTLTKKKLSPLIREQYFNYKNLLRTSKALFSLKETISTAETIKAAQESAATIQHQLTEIENTQAILRDAQTRAEDTDIPMLTTEIEVMEQLQSCFQDAMLAYREIQDEVQIEESYDSLHDLKSTILLHSTSLAQKARTLGLNEAEFELNNLTDLLSSPAFQLDEVLSLPQHPSVFLDHLATLDSKYDLFCIIDTHGKVALDPLPEKQANHTYPVALKREWVAGTNVVREGLCRGWGIHIVQQFDKEFEPLMTRSLPLQVLNLKKFLLDARGIQKYARSFFIPLEMTHEDFLRHLKNLKDTLDKESPSFNMFTADQVIKVDAATLAFNSFDKKPLTPSQETIAAAELRQRQAGFDYVRKALETAFPEASLSAKQLKKVLEKFDAQFKIDRSIDEKPLLSLITAAKFINDQKAILQKRSYWEKNISPFLDRDALIANALNGLSYTIGSHFGTIILFTLYSALLVWLTHGTPVHSSST